MFAISIFWLLPVSVAWAFTAWQAYRLGLVIGEGRAVRLQITRTDTLLHRWRTEQRP